MTPNEIADLILEANPKCALSGSLALNAQGYKTRRRPEDVDIYVPYGVEIETIEGMDYDDAEYNEEDYVNEYYERMPYKYKGVKIDFFKPLDNKVPELIITRIYGMRTIPRIAFLRCVVPHHIMALKFQHASDSSRSKVKHRNDIMFMMQQIEPIIPYPESNS